MKRGDLVLMLLTVGALASCSTFRTAYERPEAPMPLNYPHADENARALLNRWWRHFNDQQLNSLVDLALKESNDLALALLRVKAAKTQARISVINPTLSASYIDEYSRPLSHDSLLYPRSRSLAGTVTYEVDLWGQLRAQRDSAAWEAKATEEDRQAAVLLLIGATANLYYEIAALNEQIAIGELSIQHARRSLNFVRTRTVAGADSKLDLAQSEQLLSAREAAQTLLTQERVEARNALTVLLGGHLWPEQSELATLPQNPPPAVDSGLPAALLARRPDVRAAELRLRETLANTDAARLAFYPQISLTGALGSASSGLTQLLQDPAATIAGVITIPFIQVNQAKFASQLARTQYDEAAVAFRQTLLKGLYDVDDALSARRQLADQGEHLEASLSEAKKMERFSEVRYRAGSASLGAWLDAQEARREAEAALSSNRLARLQNYVTLCEALGGSDTTVDNPSLRD
jgi:NodT family efflux transporter outer membrane factor (OMF) lipoprotein